MPIDPETRASLRASMEWADATLYNNFATTAGLPVLSQSDAADTMRGLRAEKMRRIRAEIEATNAD